MTKPKHGIHATPYPRRSDSRWVDWPDSDGCVYRKYNQAYTGSRSPSRTLPRGRGYLLPVIPHNFINLSNISNILRYFMEEHTCEARLPHINGNAVIQWEISWDKGVHVPGMTGWGEQNACFGLWSEGNGAWCAHRHCLYQLVEVNL